MPHYAVILEATTTGAGLNILDSALKNNLIPVFLTDNINKYKKFNLMRYSEKGVKIHEIDTTSLMDIKQCIAQYTPITSIVCTNDKCISLAAALAEEYHLPFSSNEAIDICRNKEKTGEFCRQHGILTPKMQVFSQADDLAHLSQTFTLPIIVKSSRGTGSAQVILCTTWSEVTQCIQDIKSRAKCDELILIQEYITGPLVSAECVVIDDKVQILGFTDRLLGKVPYFVERGFSFPAELPDEPTSALHATLQKLFSALPKCLGFFHIEFILAEQGPTLIEINPRLGGSLLGPIMCTALGIDIYDAIIKMALGKKPTLQRQSATAVTVELLYPEKNGTICDIFGIDLARGFPGVTEVKQHAFINDVVAPPQNFASAQLAHVIATGANMSLSKLNCQAAVSNITFDIA